MLLQDSRRAARVGAEGELILLADQDRSLWDRKQIEAGLALARRSLDRRSAASTPPPGPYALQAAIAAEHAGARSADETSWTRIRSLYDRLAVVQPSPVVALNRGVAIAMAEGPEAGLAAIDEIDGLDSYMHLHSSRADLLRRAQRRPEAADAYRRAIELATNPVQRSFLERRLAELWQR